MAECVIQYSIPGLILLEFVLWCVAVSLNQFSDFVFGSQILSVNWHLQVKGLNHFYAVV